MTPAPTQLLHASCVSVAGQGLLILGASGAGKSALALQLMALGADLVADDQTLISARNGQLIASAPAQISGMIEARFIGLLNAPTLPETAVSLVLDLDRVETERLPPQRQIALLGVDCALAYSNPSPHLGSALMCYLKHGRRA